MRPRQRERLVEVTGGRGDPQELVELRGRLAEALFDGDDEALRGRAQAAVGRFGEVGSGGARRAGRGRRALCWTGSPPAH